MVESSVRETYSAAVARPVAFALGVLFGVSVVSLAWYFIDRNTEKQLSLLRDENVHQERALDAALQAKLDLEKKITALQSELSAAQQAVANAEEWEYSPASEPIFNLSATKQKLESLELNPEQQMIVSYLFAKDGARSGMIGEGVGLTVGRVDYELEGLNSNGLVAAGTCHRKGETTLYTCWGLTAFGRKYVVNKLDGQSSTPMDSQQSSTSMERQ
ncbi:MAG: hypothetical protein ACRECX_08985 [Methyloceanibacter sp.]|uniref:hypothetical protein n=1 Tax=Methyloceanibacter sp. TaxID=1965321 RepID=UPI003D6CC057